MRAVVALIGASLLLIDGLARLALHALPAIVAAVYCGLIAGLVTYAAAAADGDAPRLLPRDGRDR